MNRWAYVYNTVVQTVTEQEFQPTVSLPFCPNGEWIACPDWVGPDDTYVDGNFVKTNPPPPLLLITKAGMISRFTNSEYAGIITASATDAQVKAWYDWLNAANMVQIDGIQVTDGLKLLVDKNLITQERATEIANAPIKQTELI